MGKRAAEDIEDGNLAYLKRQKIGNVVEKTNPAVEIHSGKQLRQLLAFDQDAARSKNGKLESISLLSTHTNLHQRSFLSRHFSMPLVTKTTMAAGLLF